MKPMILIGQVNIPPGDNSNVGAFLLPRRGWFRDYESPSKLLTDFYKYITVGSPAEVHVEREAAWGRDALGS